MIIKRGLILFLSVCFSITSVMGGTIPKSFRIISNTSGISDDVISQSIIASDFEQFRYASNRTTLEFENGFKVELFSAVELIEMKSIENIHSYKSFDTPGFQMPLFKLHDDGQITALFSKQGGKSTFQSPSEK